MKITSMYLSLLALTTLMATVPSLVAVEIPWSNDGVAKKKTVSSDKLPVTLTWTGSHNVMKFVDKTAHDNCDFTGATEICPQLSDSTCELTGLSEGNTYYYGCSVYGGGHCTGGQQKLTLTVSKPSSGGGGLFDMCF